MNYKEILHNVLHNGVVKQPVRFNENKQPILVENSTITLFCEIFRHNMNKGFPATTLRRLPIKSAMIELEGFINGITDKKWYQERGCKFWDSWASPTTVKRILRDHPEKNINEVMSECNDLGPIYGSQWRNFNGQHIDQLKDIVNNLKTNPYDRRMVCSAWNPIGLEDMALPPCHYCFTIVVNENKLNLCWKQRSCDLVRGVPNNIISYAALLLLFCKESGLEPGELVGILEDCHIYLNQIRGVKLLLERKERELPQFEITSQGLFDWTHKDYKIINYNPLPNNIDLGELTV